MLVMVRLLLVTLLTVLLASLFAGAILIWNSHGPVPFIALLALLVWVSRRGSQQAGTLGTARFAGFADLVLAGLLSNQRGLLLGKTGSLEPPTFNERVASLFELPLWASRQALTIFQANSLGPSLAAAPRIHHVHTCTIAPTGAGKSSAFVIPNLLMDRFSSAIVLDFKAELIRHTYQQRLEMGQQVIVIAPFGLPPGINVPISRFNPLLLTDANHPCFLDDAAMLANSLVIRPASEHQPFFNDKAELTIRAILTVLLAEDSPAGCTLGNLRNILAIAEKVRGHGRVYDEFNNGLLRQLAGPLMELLEGRERQAILATIDTHLPSLIHRLLLNHCQYLTSSLPISSTPQRHDHLYPHTCPADCKLQPLHSEC